MKIVFFHDNKITTKNGDLYSSGGLNDKIISRYLKLSREFSLATRDDKSRVVENLTYVGNSDSISFNSIPNLAGIKWINYKQAYKLISKVIDENDFMIIRLPSIIGLIAVFIAKRKHKNYLIELVGCPWDSYRLHSLKGRLIGGPLYLITKFFVKNASNILYVTDTFLQKRYPSKSKQQIGCSDVELTIEEGVLEKRLGKISLRDSKSKIKIGMIGFVEAKYKGFDTAIRALSVLKEKGHINYQLEIVGGGNQLYLEKLIEKHNLKDQVIIVGTLSHPQGIFNWLDSIDIYMQPSRTEGLPRGLIEAMSRACACIGSNSGEIPQLIDSFYIHKKSDFKKLSLLILKLSNIEKMKANASNSFFKAQQYDKKVLDYKRELFYEECIKK